MNEQILINVTPQETRVAVTELGSVQEQRIEDEAEREHLREKVVSLIPPGEIGGFIVRTVAETAADGELTADIEYLATLWKQIQLAAQSAPPQALLYQDLSLASRVLRDL